MARTGPDASDQDPSVKGAQLAVDLANKSGKYKAKIQLDVQDDVDKPATAVTVATKFCQNSSMIAAIANGASVTTLATQSLYSECGMPQLVPSASNDTLTQKGFKNFFRVTAKNSDEASHGAAWIVKNLPNVKNIGTIDANDATTAGIANEFVADAKTKGLNSVGQIHITTGGTDFRGPLTSLLNSHPDLIYFALFVADGSLAAKQARQLGYTGSILAVDAMFTPEYAKLAGAAAEGTYITNLGVDPSQDPNAQSFVSAYSTAYGEPPSAFAAHAYDIVNLVLAAWEADGEGTDRAKLVARIAQTNTTGVEGPISFDQNGDLVQSSVGMYQVKGGKITFVGAA